MKHCVSCVSLLGVDYQDRDAANMLLEQELNDGDITEEEYVCCCWSADEVWPEGGWVANPRMEGPGIRRPRGRNGGRGH